jgi:hypothetical protein
MAQRYNGGLGMGTSSDAQASKAVSHISILQQKQSKTVKNHKKEVNPSCY